MLAPPQGFEHVDLSLRNHLTFVPTFLESFTTFVRAASNLESSILHFNGHYDVKANFVKEVDLDQYKLMQRLL